MASLIAAHTIEHLSTPLQSLSISENFLIKLNKCKNEINVKFKEIFEKLFIRQNRLLLQIDDIAKRFYESQNFENSIKEKLKMQNDQRRVLEAAMNIFPKEAILPMKVAIADLDSEIYNLREKMEIFSNIEIEIDSINLENLIEKLGNINFKQSWDYSNYTPHVICNKTQYLHYPRGVAIDDDENLYVSSWGNNDISVLTMAGDCLRKFGNDLLRNPWAIAIANSYLYVTDESSLYRYTLTGELVNSINSYGSFNTKFQYARGVHADYNGFVFVCDTDNNCIPIFNENLEIERMISHVKIKEPFDVKTNYEQIYILTSKVLHIMSEEGSYLKEISELFNNAHFFAIDHYNNIIISDYHDTSDNNIIIISPSNNSKYGLGNSARSYGIALTKNNSIVNVCSSSSGLWSNPVLQLFYI